MQRKKVVEVPKPESETPPGFYMVQLGNSRVLFDAHGQPKPPTEVLPFKAPARAAPSSKRKRQP